MLHPIDRIAGATARLGAQLDGRDASVCARALDDEALLGGLADISEARKALSLLESAYSAEVEVRSDRSLGYAGLAQRTGHRTGTALIQHVTGQTRSDVQKSTSAGRDLAGTLPIPGPDPDAEPDAAPPPSRWFQPLVDALTSGALSREQYDAIRRGLGEPPERNYPDLAPGFLVAGWREAAIQLIDEASDRAVEDLRADARLARDSLDPKGVQTRFDERFANRSFRWWIDETGQQRATIAFDDDAAAWWRTILSASLRPRRGPRFVGAPDAETDAVPGDAADPTGEATEGAVEPDRRSNEQLQYDTLVAVLRTGALADPTQAFGDRQPGVRIVATREEVERRDEHGHLIGVAHFEETGQTIPGSVLETYLCDAGTKTVTVDSFGNPLDVGRDQRLFTKRQRDAISIRDGGCLDCGAEPSRCEVHHSSHWWEHGGRTDTADGLLLCRNCHMRVHNLKLRVIRRGTEFWLHSPPDSEGNPTAPPRLLRSRSLLRYERRAP